LLKRFDIISSGKDLILYLEMVATGSGGGGDWQATRQWRNGFSMAAYFHMATSGGGTVMVEKAGWRKKTRT